MRDGSGEPGRGQKVKANEARSEKPYGMEPMNKTRGLGAMHTKAQSQSRYYGWGTMNQKGANQSKRYRRGARSQRAQSNRKLEARGHESKGQTRPKSRGEPMNPKGVAQSKRHSRGPQTKGVRHTKVTAH